jgi:GTP-binding protein
MEIKSAEYLISNAEFDKCPKPDRPEYAFIGRSNVGKSSLINMLCNQTHLAKTSSTPGKTQLINHFEIVSSDNKKWYLVDLPGYGFAKVAQRDRRRWEQMIEGYLRKRENLASIFVLIDSRHTPQAIDIEFINKLGLWGIPFAIVFTKTDKNKPNATANHVKLFIDALKQTWEEIPAYFISSALNKAGRKEILAYISQLNA